MSEWRIGDPLISGGSIYFGQVCKLTHTTFPNSNGYTYFNQSSDLQSLELMDQLRLVWSSVVTQEEQNLEKYVLVRRLRRTFVLEPSHWIKDKPITRFKSLHAILKVSAITLAVCTWMSLPPFHFFDGRFREISFISYIISDLNKPAHPLTDNG